MNSGRRYLGQGRTKMIYNGANEMVISRNSVMSDEKQVERIWVGIPQAAEITSRPKEYLRQIMASIWGMPAEERPLKVRFRSKRYEFWLPDLVHYLENSGEAEAEKEPNIEPIWVMTHEAAEITGYSQRYIQQLVYKIQHLPEAERPIRLRSRAFRNELWLPDLIHYVENIGYGPASKRSPKT